MKTTGEFLSHLSRIDVKLWDEDGALRYSAPKGALTPDLLEQLRSRKGEILALLQQARQSAAPPPIQAIARNGAPDDGSLFSAPLSFAQQRLWFLDQLEEQSTAYNISLTVRLAGQLEIDALAQSLTEIVRRHESLRTNFVAVAGQPAQVIHPPQSVILPIVDLGQVPAAEHEAQVQQRANEQARQPFDLTRDTLWRVSLLRLTAPRGHPTHVLLLTVHHIIFDGWSIGVFIQELSTLYAAFAQGADRGRTSSLLPALPVQYVDFAHWQHQWLQGDVLARRLNYWKQHLAGAPQVLQLPTDRPRPAIQTLRGNTTSFTISAALTRQLNALRVNADETLFMILLAAFKILLWRYSNQADIVVGTPSANRNRQEIEPLIGLFANTLVLRTNLSGNPTFRELLGRVRTVTLGAIEHQDLPFEKLVEELQPARNLSHNPLFQVMFIMQNAPIKIAAQAGLTITPTLLGTGAAMFDLTLSVQESDAGLHCLLEYNTDLFDATTIERMSGHFQTLLAAIAAAPGQCIAELPLLTAAERQQLLVTWSQTASSSPDTRCVHQLFEAQVELTPDAVAVQFENQKLRYRELNARANQLAHHLQALGVGPETLVGICVERSLDMMVGLLGILKTGGAYVPLDPAFPKERLAFMIEDAQPLVLLTQKKLVGDLPVAAPAIQNPGSPLGPKIVNPHVVRLDADWTTIAQASKENATSGVGSGVPSGTGAENLAYVLYTSGSTGRPKGVQIEHRALTNFLHTMRQQPGLTAQDVLLAVTTISFDIAGLELYLPLVTGARIVLASSAVAADGLQLLKLLNQCGATVMQATPATWRMLLAAGWAGSPQLKMLCGGEALPQSLADQLLAKGASLWNMYGPTETTIWSAIHQVQANRPQTDAAVPIGGGPLGAIANTQLYILDAHRQPVPIGVPGELYIGGAGLARGYLNRPELTDSRFLILDFGLNDSSDSQNPKSKIQNCIAPAISPATCPTARSSSSGASTTR